MRNLILEGGKHVGTATLGVLLLMLLPAMSMAQIPQSEDSTRVATPSAEATPKASSADQRYRIGPGDVIEVLVYNQPQLTRPSLRVDALGMIRMPLLEGEIKAACKTESELGKELTVRYQEYQKYPQVEVYVKEYNSQLVAIVGAVNSPGRFQLQRRVRLFEILTLAGGPNATAGRTVQIVHAPNSPIVCEDENENGHEEGKAEISFYDLNATLRAEDTANPYLKAGDVITVPTAEEIYILGNVHKPSTIPLKESVTISKAITMAGGVLPDADSKHVRITRQAPGANKTELVVNLKEINKGAAEDIPLQANDVVQVSGASGAKSVFKGILQTLVPSFTRLPMRVVY